MVNKPQEYPFLCRKKLTIAQLLLEELNVDRNRFCTVSEGEFQGKRDYGLGLDKGYDDRIEVLTFVDGGLSIEWMKKQG
jgi:D-citramalate synthase